jgi:hypothetical protein
MKSKSKQCPNGYGYETMVYQAGKRYRAILACNTMAVLPSVRDDVARSGCRLQTLWFYEHFFSVKKK